MSRIDCRGGHTQIGKVLSHARQEHAKQRVQALVFVGDAMEEKIDDLCAAPANSACSACRSSCSRRATMRWPRTPIAKIARLSRGAYCRFDTGAAHELGELLRAVAAYAAGGRRRWPNCRRAARAARRLLAQLK